MAELPEWLQGDYIALADKCYFVDAASYIVRTEPVVENFKLSPESTLVARFLFQGVKREMVAAILADHFHYEEHYGGEALAAAREKVSKVLLELWNEGTPLIQAGTRPNPPRNPDLSLEKMSVGMMVTSILPAIGTTIKPKYTY
jgi:hypothetical protein